MPTADHLHAEPSRFQLRGTVEVQEHGVLVGRHDLARLFAERFGMAVVEDAGGGERRAGSAIISVEFKA